MASLSQIRTKLREHRVGERLRFLLAAVALALSTWYFLTKVDPHYPIQHWLFWSYAAQWGWCALMTLGCLSVGNLAYVAIAGTRVPLRERLLMAMALGVLIFFLALFVGGVFGLFGPVFAVLLPLLLFAVGAWPLFKLARRCLRHLRAARRRGISARPWWHVPILGYGLICLGLVYFSILSANNIAFDSYFYHLGLAQQYAVEGGIRSSPEGWLPAALPHLASVLYTWAFLLPGFNLFERISCAAHLEFVLFLWTLAGVPVLVRWLAPGSRGRLAWVSVFLFPGILLYDSGLSVAADHVAAFWAIPIFVALRRSWRALDPRSCLLLAAVLAGALLTKYQALYLLTFPVLAVMLRTLWLVARGWIRRRKKDPTADLSTPLLGLATAAAAGLMLTAPHWLKNWIWYGDPLFPYLHRFFDLSQWEPDLSEHVAQFSAWQSGRWTPKGTTSERLRETLEVLWSFSFEPHDWPKLHGKVPVFGSLFTLSLVVLPFLKRTRRIWALMLAAHMAVFIWYWTLHQDRYLQVVLPWMAAATAATLVLAWRSHVSARLLATVLVSAQVVWGGDVYFIPAHAMTKRSPAITTSKLLAQGYKKNYDKRFQLRTSFPKFAPSLPEDAKVLVHQGNLRLGLWRPVVVDSSWQFRLRYELLHSAAEVHQQLRSLGVTHIIARPGTSHTVDSLGADLRFFEYLKLTQSQKRVGGWTLHRMPEQPPGAPAADQVLYLGCNRKLYQRGLHPLAALSVRQRGLKQVVAVKAQRPAPDDPDELRAMADESHFLVTGAKCRAPVVPKSVTVDFKLLAKRGKDKLYVRR